MGGFCLHVQNPQIYREPHGSRLRDTFPLCLGLMVYKIRVIIMHILLGCWENQVRKWTGKLFNCDNQV